MKRYETQSGAVYLVDWQNKRYKRQGPEVVGTRHPDGEWHSFVGGGYAAKGFDFLGPDRWLSFVYSDGSVRHTTRVVSVKEVGSDG